MRECFHGVKDNDFLKKADRYPKLNFPGCRLRVTRRGADDLVWDPVRGRWLALTPEEWVRRHVLSYLSEFASVPPANISQEHPLEVNGVMRRADVVVTGGDARPVMLIECKAPGVAVCGATLEQAFHYNSVLGARYVMLTNGLDHYIYEVRSGEYAPLKDFPELVL